MVNNRVNTDITVSNLIDITKLDPTKINLLVSGTGTGKTHFALRALSQKLNTNLPDNLKHLQNIKREEILLITSRKITEEQQGDNYNDVAYNLNYKRIDKRSNSTFFSTYIDLLDDNGTYIGTVKDRIYSLKDKTPITNYNFFNENFDDELLSKLKIIILDEFHALFSDANYNIYMDKVYDDLDNLINKGILIIGMTATDDDIPQRKSKFNYLLDEPFYKYKITNSFNIVKRKTYAENIIKNLEGKTLIMCFSVEECIRLTNKIPNSRALVSRQNKNRTSKMNNLEKYIIRNKTLPTHVKNLFTTSMAREGFEFTDKTNIKNVVIYNSDPVTIKQFVGRFRGNIENLYIVYEPLLNIDKINNQLTKQQRKHHEEFKRLIYKNDYTWSKRFSCIIDKDKFNSINYIDEGVVEQQFLDYMIENWCGKPIYTKEQKQEIVDYAYNLGIKYTTSNHKHNFNSLIKIIKTEEDLKFIHSGNPIRQGNKIIRPYLFRLKESIEDYLNGLLDKRLHKEEQEEIKQRLNCKQVNKINEKIKQYNLSIESKKVKEKGKTIQVWIIKRI